MVIPYVSLGKSIQKVLGWDSFFLNLTNWQVKIYNGEVMETKSEPKKRGQKHSAVEPRKSSSEYATLTMVVNRDWSDEVSKKAREKNMSKTAYIAAIVNEEMKTSENNTTTEKLLKEMTELNKKVDVLTDLYSSLLKFVSKLK